MCRCGFAFVLFGWLIQERVRIQVVLELSDNSWEFLLTRGCSRKFLLTKKGSAMGRLFVSIILPAWSPRQCSKVGMRHRRGYLRPAARPASVLQATCITEDLETPCSPNPAFNDTIYGFLLSGPQSLQFDWLWWRSVPIAAMSKTFTPSA